MKYVSNIKQNYLFSIVYQILVLILPLITTPYISRVFGSGGVGAYTLVNSIAVYFTQFAGLGVSNYGNRSVAACRDNEKMLKQTFSEIYAAQVVTSLAVTGLYILYASSIAQGNQLLVWLHVLYVMSAVFDVSWLFFGLEKFKITVTGNLIVKILSVISIFLFVKNAEDIWIYTLIMVISILTNAVFLWIIAWKYVDFHVVPWNKIVYHLKPMIVLFIPVIAASVYKTMDKVMLGIITKRDSWVGLYNNSEQLIGFPQGIITALGVVMLPRVTNMLANGNIRRAKQELRVSMKFINFLACAVSFGMAGISVELAPIFLGEAFRDCGKYVILLSPCNIFISWAYGIRNQYLIPNMKDKIYVNSVVAGAVLNFLVNLILIRYLGITGAIIGTLIAESLVAIWQTVAVRKELDVKRYLVEGFPFVFFGMIMFVVVRSIGNLLGEHITTIFAEVVCGGLIYLICSFIYILKSDLELLEMIFKKAKHNEER